MIMAVTKGMENGEWGMGNIGQRCYGYSFFLCSLLHMLMFFLAFACFYFNLLCKFRSVHFTLSFPHSDLL